jgi:hypothetical protein
MTDVGIAELEATKSRLRKAAESFRLWAAEESPIFVRSGEWEVDYGEWEEIYRAYSDLLGAIQPEDLTHELSHQLLYLLARDNEIEFLKRELVARPLHLFALVKAAQLSDEMDARWQIADALGSVEASDENVVPVLEVFVVDHDEYVSRRALLALARRKSSTIEPWAVRAWETGDLYQRIAALDALANKGSALLEPYLAKAQADGREYLVSFATELRDGGVRS